MNSLQSSGEYFPPINPTSNHKIYVKCPIINELESHPKNYSDIWDGSHVRMPCSDSAMCSKMCLESGKTTLLPRWPLICDAFKQSIYSFSDLRKAILLYNERYTSRWHFSGIKHLIDVEFTEIERNCFFESILPKIINLALGLPHILTRPPKLLRKNKSLSISLSQKQVASLLANAFLCTFPRRNAKGPQAEFINFPDINFNRLLGIKDKTGLEKLKCIINYFCIIADREDKDIGMMTFSRQCVPECETPDFEVRSDKISGLEVRTSGFIEDCRGFLQVDFANKYVGGGVLGYGCVQEEIRFVLCPELLVSMLFTEVLGPREALIVSGVEQFNKCEGYGSEFRWVSAYTDDTAWDRYRRKLCQVVAIDALFFRKNVMSQYKPEFVTREIIKAYCGFKTLTDKAGSSPAIATGNWGCGAFRGNPRLKALIQLAAASTVKRDLLYLTFGDDQLKRDLENIYSILQASNTSVGQLVMALYQYGSHKSIDGSDILDYVSRAVSHLDSDTDSDSGFDPNVNKMVCGASELTSETTVNNGEKHANNDNGLYTNHEERELKEKRNSCHNDNSSSSTAVLQKSRNSNSGRERKITDFFQKKPYSSSALIAPTSAGEKRKRRSSSE